MGYQGIGRTTPRSKERENHYFLGLPQLTRIIFSVFMQGGSHVMSYSPGRPEWRNPK